MLSLAVFYFVFLGTEYLFDNRMALYTDPSGVVLAQSYILGVSVFGFLAYSLIEKWKSKSGNPTAFKAAGFFLPVPVILIHQARHLKYFLIKHCFQEVFQS